MINDNILYLKRMEFARYYHQTAGLLEDGLDDFYNAEMYAKESKTAGVVYGIYNCHDGKVYVGSAHSYLKNGAQGEIRHGAHGRFYKHYNAAKQNTDECPGFYEVLSNSEPSDWLIIVLDVCTDLSKLIELEEEITRMLQADNPEYGYNIMNGNKKPTSEQRSKEFKKKKELGNRNRAIGGKLRKSARTKNLPPNINERYDKNGNFAGYFAQIKINDVLYNKAFLSAKIPKADRLQMAIKFIEECKKNN